MVKFPNNTFLHWNAEGSIDISSATFRTYLKTLIQTFLLCSQHCSNRGWYTKIIHGKLRGSTHYFITTKELAVQTFIKNVGSNDRIMQWLSHFVFGMYIRYLTNNVSSNALLRCQLDTDIYLIEHPIKRRHVFLQHYAFFLPRVVTHL